MKRAAIDTSASLQCWINCTACSPRRLAGACMGIQETGARALTEIPGHYGGDGRTDTQRQICRQAQCSGLWRLNTCEGWAGFAVALAKYLSWRGGPLTLWRGRLRLYDPILARLQEKFNN